MKILLYSLVAVVLGLLLVLVPLITISDVKANDYALPMPEHLSRQLEKLEGTYTLNADVTIFAIGFVIALVVYLLFKYILPRHDYGKIMPYPY